jgi:hypothetical protein
MRLQATDVCWRMLTYADVEQRLQDCKLTYADRMLTYAVEQRLQECAESLKYADVCWPYADVCCWAAVTRVCREPQVCWHMLTYADRMLTYAVEQRLQECAESLKFERRKPPPKESKEASRGRQEFSLRGAGTSVWGLKLLVYEALKLLVYEVLYEALSC